ncbi:MAG: hypothetical protein CMM01_16740 [Rhodopirellula sp.]|nr:hypothetical protein [Rhodopirellula sp.]
MSRIREKHTDTTLMKALGWVGGIAGLGLAIAGALLSALAILMVLIFWLALYVLSGDPFWFWNGLP